MSSPRGNDRPLVADKRYGQKPPAPKKPAPRKERGRRARAATPVKRGPIGTILHALASLLRWIVRLIWRFTWRIGLVFTILIGLGIAYYASTLPDMTELVDGRARGSVTLLDRNGEPYAWRGDQFGGMITADTVSPHLHNAVVATEDKRFYRHFGVSPRGIASAIRINLREGRGPLSGNGGSTITQQTAKLLCLGRPYDPTEWENEAAYEADCRRTTLWRKVQEALYAMAMEVRYTKEEILSIYLNRAYLGAGSRGFEAASQAYFGVSSAVVDPAQAAMLAGLLKAPSTYAPTANLQRAQDRANIVIGLMEDQGYISASEAAEARAYPATLSATARRRAGGYFADWVMESGPDFFTRDTTEDVIIRTTIDPRIQTAAEEALSTVFETRVREGSKAQAAIVVMSADGAVRAMVGGRNTQASGAFNRATQALRQTGSAFKPFVYATALDMGMRPLDTVIDEPRCWSTPGQPDWCPRNYDRTFHGRVTLADALRSSMNVPAVIVSETVGRENVSTVAEMFGIRNELSAGPSLALGTSESTLIEMTGAYAGILNGGSAVAPYGLIELRLKDDAEPLLSISGGIRERVISERAARSLTWMMYNVVQDGTGQRAKIDGWQIAGKTGTTQSARDAWFIGFSADYVTGVWMGYDDNTPLTGVTGGGLPAEIWQETMSRVLSGQPRNELPMDVPVPVTPVPQPQQMDQPTTGPNMTQSEAEDLINNLILELQSQ